MRSTNGQAEAGGRSLPAPFRMPPLTPGRDKKFPSMSPARSPPLQQLLMSPNPRNDPLLDALNASPARQHKGVEEVAKDMVDFSSRATAVLFTYHDRYGPEKIWLNSSHVLWYGRSSTKSVTRENCLYRNICHC